MTATERGVQLRNVCELLQAEGPRGAVDRDLPPLLFIALGWSLRRIAKRFAGQRGASFANLALRSRREGWMERRRQHQLRVLTRTVDALNDQYRPD